MPVQSPDGEDFDVARFVKRRRSLRSDFSSYVDQLDEIAQNFSPRRGQYIREASGQDKITGKKLHQQVINTTPLRVSKNAQSGLQAGVTSPSRPWKKVGPADPTLRDVPGSAEFYTELDRTIDFVYAKSNFYRATHTAYGDFVDFGVAAVQIDEHADDIIRCQTHPMGSWVGACNSDGRVDVFYRDYRPHGHEIMTKFGREQLPTEILDKIKLNPYNRMDLYNAIEPNPFYAGRGSIGIPAFKYLSVWWIKGHDRDFIKVHGYHEFPVMVFRMYKSENGDAYGYGAGYDGLGDAKQLQHMERKKLRALDKTVEPPLQAPTALRNKGVSMVSGKVTYHDGPGKVESLYNLNLPLQYVLQDIDSVQQRLSEMFFEDLFLMITSSVQRQTTAREIEERHEEKLIMLGPVLESINDEFLDPGIDRTLGITRRAGMFPPAPPELEGSDLKVEYISILAQAQRAIQTIAIEQGVNFAVAAAANGLPSVLDRINADGTVDEYFERIGYPPKGIRSLRDAEELRGLRAQQQQQERNLALAGEAAKMTKDVTDAGITQPNVLSQLLNAPGQAA